jgi:alpha-tubulin suppressor-like RCC1 family protein
MEADNRRMGLFKDDSRITQVQKSTGIYGIASGWKQYAGVRSEGTLWAWGVGTPIHLRIIPTLNKTIGQIIATSQNH